MVLLFGSIFSALYFFANGYLFYLFFVVKNSAVQYRSNYKVVRSTWVTVQHPAFAINNYCIANAAALNSSQKLQSSHRLQIIKPSPHIVRRGIN